VTAILTSEQRYYCPNCDEKDVHVGAPLQPGQTSGRFHACAGLAGLTAPLILEGVRCKVEAHEREDYIGDELLTYDGNGRPIMNVTVTRDNGQDCAVFAPCINVPLRSML
jgi:hypothetical protein